MTQVFKTVLSSLSVTLIAVFLWAFSGTETFEMKEEPPGTIQVTGVAGGPRVFTFEKWKIEKLNWTPGNFETIDIAVLIDCKSLTHEWKDLEKSIRKKKDYFYVKKFPTASASVKGATKIRDNLYEAKMTLGLKGVTKDVPITFEVSGDGSEANPYRAVGKGELNRRKFKFNGGGPENQVPLNFDIVLK